MLKILSLLSPGHFLLLTIVSLLALLTGLGLLGAAAFLITKAALAPPLYTLTIGITAVRACGIGRAVFRYGERYLTHESAFNLLTHLRLRLYDIACQKISQPKKKLPQGTMLQQLLSGAETVQNFFLRGLMPPLVTLLASLLLVLLLWPHINAWSLLILLVWGCQLLPVAAAPHISQERESLYRGALLDYSQGQRELVTAGSLALAISRLDKSGTQWQSKLQQEQQTLYRTDLALGLLRTAGYILLASALIPSIGVTLDGITFAVYLLLLLTLFAEFAPLPAAARQFRLAKDAMHGLAPPAKTDAPDVNITENGHLLAVHNLAFAYPQSVPLFTGLDFTIVPGGHTAIIGDSGSGKTTLALLLAGLWAPTTGRIDYGQRTPTDLIAAIPQGCWLFAASIRANFEHLYPDITEAAIHDSLQTAQLSQVVQKLPQGIDTPLGENACCLSGGERNRLQAALLLASPAPVLLFDEPTAGLDKSTADKLLNAIIDKSTLTGQTVIVITHDLPQLHRFSQVINLSPT